MGANTHYLELMFILLNIFQPQKLIKKTCLQRPYFEEKRQKALEKKLGCKFIRNDTGKRYDDDYEIGKIQTFISKFKDKKLKKLHKNLNQLEDKIEKLPVQITQ